MPAHLLEGKFYSCFLTLRCAELLQPRHGPCLVDILSDSLKMS